MIQALRDLPDESPYFFWSGHSKLRTAIGNARKSVSRVCKLAGIKNGHPHRFRDTFAIELLKNGATLHTVHLLLGHKSIRTTEKHYAPFVLEFQQAIDAATAKLSYGTRTKYRTISEEDPQANETKEVSWRKPVGVEPTRDTKYRTPGLKSGPGTGRDWLPQWVLGRSAHGNCSSGLN